MNRENIVSPVQNGLAYAVNRLQVLLFDNLPWIERGYGLASDGFRESAEKVTLTVPEVYTGNGRYQDVLPDGQRMGHFFFYADGPEKVEEFNPYASSKMSCQVSLIVWVDLDKISRQLALGYDHRFTDELIDEAMGLLVQHGQFKPSSVERKATEVWKNWTVGRGVLYYGDRKEYAQTQVFKHPEAGFRITGTLYYDKECQPLPDITGEPYSVPATTGHHHDDRYALKNHSHAGMADFETQWGSITGSITDQSDLIAKLGEYALAGHTHDYSTVFAALNHDHDTVYAPFIHSHDYAATNHTHDYSAVYAPLSHDHDEAYSQLGHTHTQYAADDHAHAFSEILLRPTTLAGYGITDAAPLGHNHDSAYSALNHLHTGVYEPVFAKNTGFNLALGTTAGTVAAGDHTHAVFTTNVAGYVPARTGATTTKFLREDGTWQIPSGTVYSIITDTEMDSTSAVTGRLLTGQRINSWATRKGFLTSLPVHNHDDLYYTEAEVNSLLTGYSLTSHTHAGYQATLVSGTNIKTLNNISLLGAGNINIQVPEVFLGSANTFTNYNSFQGISATSGSFSSWVSASSFTEGGEALAAKYAPVAHTHDGVYAPALHSHPYTDYSGYFADISHNHDTFYAPIEHSHDDYYYTETEVNSLLAGYALAVHNHDEAYASVGHLHTLDALSDVVLTSPASGQVLKYNGTNWVNDTDSGGGGAAWGSITGTLSSQTDLQTALNGKAAATHNHDGIYEPVIGAKGNAFNTSFGISSGEAAEGDHSHLFSKSITVEAVTASESIVWFYTHDIHKLVSVAVVVTGSVTFNVVWGSTPTANTLQLFSSNKAMTDAYGLQTITGSTTINSGNYVRVITTASSGTTPTLHITLTYSTGTNVAGLSGDFGGGMG